MLLQKPLSAQEAVFTNWVNHFAHNDSIMPNPMTSDPQRNVYVAGYENNGSSHGPDIVIVKYTEFGDTVWTNRYSGYGNNRDQATAIAYDSINKCVYVAGFSYYSPTNDYDAILIKYNQYGDEQWVRNYNGTASFYDAASAICIANNYVYITGASFGGLGTLVDYFTIKYKFDGTQVWVSRYDNNGNNEIAYAITVGSNDSVFVTGGSQSSSNNWDYATVVYDSTGTQAYVTRVSGAGYGLDRATAIASDKKGYVYFTGAYMDVSGNYDFKTIKMNSAGTIIYNKVYNFENLDDIANAIAVDTMGNAYVVGQSKSLLNDNDIVIIKYDSVGNQAWIKRFDGDAHGSDIGHNIFWDIFNNNVYITGETYNGSNQDYITIAYNHNGQELWHQFYDEGGDDIASDITADDKEVYVTGSCQNGGDVRYVTIDYVFTDYIVPPDTEAVSGTTAFFPNSGQIMRTDSTAASEVIYYTLHNYPANYFLEDTISYVFSSKVDTTYHTDTLQRIDMSFYMPDRGSDSKPIGTDKLSSGYLNYYLPQCPDGITEVYGYEKVLYPEIYPHIDALFTGNGDGLKYYIIAKPGADTSQIELQFDGADSVNIIGDSTLEIVSHWGTIYHERPEVYQVDAYGNRVSLSWAANYYSPSAGHVRFHLNTYDISKPLVVQVNRRHLNPSNSTNGNLWWSTMYGSIADDYGLDVAVDPLENSYEVGRTYSSHFPVSTGAFQYTFSGTVDGFVICFDYIANRKWATFIGSNDISAVQGVNYNTVVSQDNLYITGYTKGTNFPFRPATDPANGSYYKNTNSGGKDAFIGRIRPSNGFATWLCFIGGEGDDEGRSITSDNAGNVYIAGNTKSSNTQSICQGTSGNYFPMCNPGSNAYFKNSNSGGSDIFIFKVDASNNLKWSTFFGSNLDDLVYEINIVNNESTYSVFICGKTKKTGSGMMANNHTPPANDFPLWYTGSQFGQTASNTNNSNAFISEFSLNGVLEWSTNFNNVNNFQTVTSTNNYVYLVGITGASGTTSSNCLPINTPFTYTVPVCDFSNYHYSTTDGGNLYIVKFDPSRALQWSTLYPGLSDIDASFIGAILEGSGEPVFYPKYIDATTDGYDNLYIVCATDGGFSTQTSTPAGMYMQEPLYNSLYNEFGGTSTLGVLPDAALLSFDINDNLVWATLFGVTADNGSTSFMYPMYCDFGTAIATYQNKDLYIVGYSGGSNWDGSSTVPHFPFADPHYGAYYYYGQNSNELHGNYDAFIARFGLDIIGVGIKEITYKKRSDLFIYPNPTQDILQVAIDQSLKGNTIVEVINVKGQVEISQRFNDLRDIFSLDISTLPDGNYILRINNQNKKIGTAKFIKI